MESFIFKGINSNSLGIIVKEMPPITKAEKNIESIQINGRNGNLHIDNKTYKSKNYSIVCVLMDQTKIDDLKYLFDGTGTLILSTEPDREYQATIKNQVDFSKYLTYLREFPLQFELDPIAYSKDENILEFSSNSNFEIGGTAEIAPILIIEGVGTISINNTQINIKETGITIDCELMECSNGEISKNNLVELDEFPKLMVGNNTITLGTGINKVTLKYKEGWL